MKVKYIILIFLTGLCLIAFGALLKILHLPGDSLLISVASFLEIAVVFVAIWTLVATDRFKEFLNS